MPVVPIYDTATEKNQPLNPVYQQGQPLAAFGAAKGAALQDIGNAAFSTGANIQARQQELAKENNKLKAIQSKTAFDDLKREYFYNPETGVFSKKGGDTLNATKNAQEFYNTKTKEIMDGMENDEQRQYFAGLISSDRNSTLESVANFEMKQRDNWTTDTLGAYKKSKMQDAYAIRNNPEAFNQRLAEISLIDAANPMGRSPEVIRQQQLADKSATVKMITENLMAANDREAMDFYNQHKDKLLPEDNIAVEKSLKPFMVDQNAIYKAQQFRGQYPGSLNEQIAAAQQDPEILKQDSAVLDKTISELKTQSLMDNQAKEEDIKNISQNIQKTIMDQRGLITETQIRQSEGFDRLPPENQQAILTFPKKVFDGAPSDPVLVKKLNLMDDEQFAQVNLEAPDIQNRISPNDYFDLAGRQQKLVSGDEKTRTGNDLITSTVKEQWKINTATKWETDEDETEALTMQNAMIKNARDKVQEEEKRQKRSLNANEVEAIVKPLFEKVETNPGPFTRTRTYLRGIGPTADQAETLADNVTDYNDIPPAEIEDAVFELRKAKRTEYKAKGLTLPDSWQPDQRSVLLQYNTKMRKLSGKQ